MTTTSTDPGAGTAAAANGRPQPAPAAAEAPCEDCTTGGERVMGVLGLAVAVLIGGIALDLLTGGAVSRLLGLDRREQASDGTG